MKKIQFELISDDRTLREGLNILCGCFPLSQGGGEKVYAVKTESECGIAFENGKTVIRYCDLPSFYYAFSYFLSADETKRESRIFSLRVKRLGFMRDTARNGAINFSAFKELTICLALAGYSYIELYTEDLFRINGLRYLGADRPAYTNRDIKAMEDFARVF